MKKTSEPHGWEWNRNERSGALRLMNLIELNLIFAVIPGSHRDNCPILDLKLEVNLGN